MSEQQSNGYCNPKKLLQLDRRFADVQTRFGLVRVRSLTAREELECQGVVTESPDNAEAYVRMRVRQIVRGVCDEDGHQVYTDRDAPAIESMDGATFNALANKITELSGSDEDLAGNLRSGQLDSSP